MKKLLLSIFSILSFAMAFSQRPIEIIPQVAMPFPFEFDELLEDYTNYTFTVINYSFSDQEIFFLVDLIGDNGVTIMTNRDYRPAEAYILPQNETRMLTGIDMEELNSGISTNDLTIDGVGPFQLAQGVIPEGNYQLCINAFDFATGEQLSVGCSFPFPVGNGDVPRIITPMEEEVIPESEVPSFLISWEQPSSDPGAAMGYDYILKIIDLSEYGDSDLEEVFLDGGVAVQLESEIMGNNYFYNAEGDDPALIFGHQYAVRVQVQDPSMEVEFENSGYSEIRTFWYGEMADTFDDKDDTPDQQENLPADCYTRCNLTVPSNATPIVDLSSISSLKIGHFYIENYNLAQSSNGFSGDGEIVLNFLNDIRLRVNIQNVQINSIGEIYSGSVRGIQDADSEISEYMEYVGFGDNVTDLADMAGDYIPADAASQIGEYLHSARLVAALAGLGNVGLPIGFNQTIKGNSFTLGITDLYLTPNSAKAKVVSGTKLAMFEGDNWLMFMADSMCIHPSGFGGEYNLSLGADLALTNDNENAFEIFFRGGESGSENISQLVMNCDGLQSVQIAGELHFARSVIVPELEDGEIGEDKAKAYFSFTLDNANNSSSSDPNAPANTNTEDETPQEPAPEGLTGMHWIAELTIDKFQVPKFKGWSFDISTAYWDMSEIQNPTDVLFPPNYHTTGIDFTGVWIENATISPPLKMCASADERTSISINNLFIDPALYCQIDIQNILELGKGKVGGWAFGIDQFTMDIWNNELLEAAMNGEIHMPLLDTSSSILYNAVIGQGESENTEPGQSPGDGDYAYGFNMSFSEDVKYSFMIAEGSISDDSFLDLQFSPSDDEETFVHARLHGTLTVSTEDFYPASLPELPANINLPSMEYSFDYHSVDGFDEDNTYVGFASPQKLLAGFPINLDNFDVGVSMTDQNEVSVDFGVQISFSQEQTDLAAGAYFSLISNLTTMSMFESVTNTSDVEDAWDAVKQIKLDRIQFDSITLDIEISKLSINGKIAFYNNPLPNGEGRDKGVRGDVSVILPIDGITGRLTAIFGNIGTPAATYSEDYFAYWYVEGLITFPVGIPLGSTGIGLYGLGGGIGKNMVQTASPTITEGEVVGQSIFEPTWNSFRLKFTAVFGTMPDPDAFNADISFIAQFVDGGLDMIGIEGNGYIMASISERPNAAVTVGMGIYMYLGNSNRDFSIDGFLNVGVNVADGLLVGNMDGNTIPNQMVSATFHASPETFFFYMGEPDFDLYDDFDPRGSAILDIEGILTAELKAYMMVGHGVPTSLPPLPIPIQNILDNPEGALGGTASASIAQGGTGGVDYETGAGFAHGIYVNVRSDIDAVLLYATLDVHLGYDMNITKRTVTCVNTGEKIGINGWYAEGQAYAGLTGGMGLSLKLLGKERNFELFQLAAAIALTGGGPNPFYFTGRAAVAYSLLGGKISGNSSFSMMVGERCTPALDDPFAGINFFELIEPEDGENEVFVGTAVHTKFALPMSEIITIPVPVEDADGVITGSINTRYRPEVTYSLHKVNGNQVVQLQSPMWSDENSHEEFYMLPQSGLEPNRNYDLTMEVKAWDYQENGWLRVDGHTWSQDTVVRFQTGDLPPDLYDYVTYTVPLPMERFFLQNEFGEGKIYFSMDIDEDYYFPTTNNSTISSIQYEYYVRFTNLETQGEVEVPFTYFNYPWTGYGLNFEIPDLDNSAVYAMQVIRKSPFIEISLASGGEIRGGQQVTEIANVQREGASTELDLLNAIPALPAETLRPGEFLLYHTYFRTSDFNRMKDKVDAANITSIDYGSSNSANYGKKLEIEMGFTEKFQRSDFNKFNAASGAYQWMEFEQRIRIMDFFQNQFHNNYAEPRVEDYRNYYVNDIYGGGLFLYPWPDNEMELDWSVSPLYRIPRSNIQTNLRPELSMDEVNSLWESYMGSTSYSNYADVFANVSTMTVIDLYSGETSTVNTNNFKLTYDTHYKVSRDRKRILDWSANYYTIISVYQFHSYLTLFQLYHPNFITQRNQLNNQSLKLNDHPGAYTLQFARNVSTMPNEELFNIFTMHNLNFNTPMVQLTATTNAPALSGTTSGSSTSTTPVISTAPTTNTPNLNFSNGFFNFSNN